MSLVGATIDVAVLSLHSAVLGLMAAEMQATGHLNGGRGPTGARPTTTDGDGRVLAARLVTGIVAMTSDNLKGEKSRI